VEGYRVEPGKESGQKPMRDAVLFGMIDMSEVVVQNSGRETSDGK